MKQIIIKLHLLVLATMLPLYTFAQTITFEDINYNVISKEDKTVEVAENYSFSGYLNVPSQIEVEDTTYTVIRISNGAFAGNTNVIGATIGDSVKYIEPGAFFGCSAMASVSLSKKLESIGISSFANCISLTSVSFPDSLITIGSAAFQYCTSLASVSFPNSLITIESAAFQYCTSLTSISFPDNVVNIGSNAFLGCSSLTTAVFGKNLKKIESEAFRDCIRLSNVQFSESVCLTNIGDMAFYECDSLTEVILPDQLNYLGSKVFRACSKLKNVHLPDSLENLPQGLFYDCRELVCVSIPKKVKTTNLEVFENCRNLKHVYVGWENNIVNCPPVIFNSISHEVMLYVPAGLAEDYKNTNWKENTVIVDGSEDSPYQIAYKYDFDKLANEVKTGNDFKNCKFLVVADIGDTITSTVGDAEHCFCGSIDGNNYSFTLGINSNDDCTGMFANLNGASISNLTLKGYVTGANNVGAFAGKASDSKFVNCINESKIIGGGNNVAGLIGYMNSSNVLNCSNIGEVINSLLLSSCTGGLVGKMEGESNITIGVNSGNVSSEGSFGAIVGECEADSEEPVLSYCLWKDSGDLSIGSVNYENIENCSSFTVDGFSATLKNPIDENSDLIDLLNSVAEEHGVLNWVLNSSFYDCMYVLSQENIGNSEEIPFVISTKNDLEQLAILVNSGKNFYEKYFIISNDIDDSLTCVVGDSLHHFCGIFDGGGHYVTLAINEPVSKFVGMFSYLENATIRNLIVKGSVAGNGYVGGVAGYGENSSIENCDNMCEISNEGDYTGGIIAYLKSVDEGRSNIYIARNGGMLKGKGYDTGGVVGHINRFVTLDGCINEGRVIGSNNNIGGIVGNSYNHNILRNAINTGDVFADSVAANIGGICGNTEYFSNFYNCSNVGKVGSETSEYVGGIAGNVSNSSFIICSNNGEIAGINLGAIAAKVSSMSSSSKYCYWRETEGLYVSTSIDFSIESSGTFNIVEGVAVLSINDNERDLIETLNNNVTTLADSSLYSWSMYRNVKNENLFVFNEMQINVSDKGWATVCLPFTAKITSDNATAYYVATSGDDIVKTEASVIPAGTGFIINSNSGEGVTVLFSPTQDDADDTNGNLMVGSLKKGGEVFCAPSYRYYVLTEGARGFQFYWDVKRKDEGRSAYCSQYKAVLAVNDEEALSREMFVLDEATDITVADGNQIRNRVANSGLYNLAGQKLVNPLKDHIYIYNGQKYLGK